MSVSWKDVAHYGAAAGLYVIGVIGASGEHIPGVTIDPVTCFATATGILAAGLKGGWTSGNVVKSIVMALGVAFVFSFPMPARAQTSTSAVPAQVQQVISQIQGAINNFINFAGQLEQTDLNLAIALAQSQGNTTAVTCWQTIEKVQIVPIPTGAGLAWFKQYYLGLSAQYVNINQSCSTVAPAYVKLYDQAIQLLQQQNL